MAYPAGVSLAVVTVGHAFTAAGGDSSVKATLTPVFPKVGGGTLSRIVHAATGTVMWPETEAFTAPAGSGISFSVPHVDQAGWRDPAQNAYTGWYYAVTVEIGGGKNKTKYVQNVQPLVGQSIVDLDMVPDGQVGDPVSAPTASVTSVNGMTGAVIVSGDGATDAALAENLATANEYTDQEITATGYTELSDTSGYAFAVKDSEGRVSELAVDQDGQVPDWALARWEDRRGWTAPLPNAGAHTQRRQVWAQRRGGRIGTGGKTVVAFRFDHHLDPWAAKVLPLLEEYGIPWSQAVNPENVGSGDDMLAWADLQAAALRSGGEVWNHGGNHFDATGRDAIHAQIAGSLDLLRANLPELVVDGWAPPGLAEGGYDGYAGFNTVEKHWDTFAGRLALSLHGGLNGYMPGSYRVLDGSNPVGQAHITMDSRSLGTLQADVRAAQNLGVGVQFMLHPNYLDQTDRLTTTDLEGFFSWLSAERDAGNLMVLSPGGLTVADAGSEYRHDLGNPDGWGTFTADTVPTRTLAAYQEVAQTVYTSRVAPMNGGVREFTVPTYIAGGGAATLVLDLPTGQVSKTFTVPADTWTTLVQPFAVPASTISFGARIIAGNNGATISVPHLYAA